MLFRVQSPLMGSPVPIQPILQNLHKRNEESPTGFHDFLFRYLVLPESHESNSSRVPFRIFDHLPPAYIFSIVEDRKVKIK